MLFSSNSFLFIFLPAVVIIYYGLLWKSRTLQNVFLLMASLFFYAWGEPYFVLIMMMSIAVNWLIGLLVASSKKAEQVSKAKAFLFIGIAINLTIIFIFKYYTFTVSNINTLLNAGIKVPDIALPIGISFFTFQAISYIVDVYRGNGVAQKNILNVGLYISFFPQLIAGPIVRYETVADQIINRRETLDDFCSGIYRFMIGFCKKVLIANNLATVADIAFAAENQGSLSVAMAWFGALAYTLQIFYDFSGYSDMAIGLGKMFGFHFLENFNYPYISKSVTEFWRRWHISLGTWFRDYVYIPLGGSRCSKNRNFINLLIVWLCTGVWHGANWTFIMWGLMYFVLLSIERFTKQTEKEGSKSAALGHIYTLFFVMMGWILFRADSISAAITYYRECFGMLGNAFIDDLFIEYARQNIAYILCGLVIAIPIVPWIKSRSTDSKLAGALCGVGLFALFVASISFLVKGSYNPFIYFNF